MKRFSKKLSLIGLSLAMLIPNISFADKIELENSIEPALVTAIVQKDQVEALCAQQSCGEVSELFTEDKFGHKTPVEGLVQLTYFKGFGYESAPEQVLSTVSHEKLDANTADMGFTAEMRKVWLVPEQVQAFCNIRDCISIGQPTLRIAEPGSMHSGLVLMVDVTYWFYLGPLPPGPGDSEDGTNTDY